MDLRRRFETLWQRVRLTGAPAPVFDDLIARYREPQRKYHTEHHLAFGLAQFDLLRDLAEDADAVELAFFFHDAIYDLRAGDNEHRSADFAAAVLNSAGVPAATLDRVRGCIVATKPGSTPANRDEEIIQDIDLAILGQPRDAFVEYERQVREEYAAIPDHAFWRARKQILQAFLERDSIYSTLTFRDRYETPARENLRWTIARH